MTTVECPYCREEAEIDAGFSCPHCGKQEKGEVAAKDYVEDVMETSHYRTVKEGGDWPISHCDECGSEAFVDLGPQENPEGGRAGVCFECGHEIHFRGYDEPGGARHCMKCGKLFEAEDGITVCPECFAETIRKD